MVLVVLIGARDATPVMLRLGPVRRNGTQSRLLANVTPKLIKIIRNGTK